MFKLLKFFDMMNFGKMFVIEGEGGTPETPATETQSPDVQSTSPEVSQAGGEPSAEQPTAQDILDYTKDERLRRMWLDPKTKTFSPNLMYKSIKSGDELIEKQYKPLKAQAETFTKLFKEYGYEPDPEKLKSAFEELKSWKDPENPIVKRGNYVSYFLDHPEYGNELTEVLEGYRKREIRKQFGEGVSDEIVNEIIANRKFREETEAKERQRIEQENHKKLVGTIDQGWSKVQEECKKIGFPVTDQIKEQLFDICAQEDVDPRFMFYKFQEMYKEEIAKHQRAMIQSELVKSREKTQKSGIIPASSTQSRQPSKPVQKASMLDRTLDRLGLKT